MSARPDAGPPLFSEEWFANLSDILGRVEPQANWPVLDLGVAIDDAPYGPVRYTFHLGPDRAEVEVGSVESAAVTLVESFDSARAIDEGAQISALLAEGRISVRGDASALVAAQGPLAAIAAILEEPAEPGPNRVREEGPR